MRNNNLRRAFPFCGIVVVLGILSIVFIQVFIRHSGEEILNSWLETEAIQIQEGNFLASLSRFSRTILSSNIVTSVTLIASSEDRREILVSYGEKLDMNDVCEKIPSPDTSIACSRGLFHEVIVYRPQTNTDFILVFENKPIIAYWFLLGILSSVSIVSVFFMSLLKNGLARESDERLYFVKKALEELIWNEQPSAVLQKDFPNIVDKWKEMQSTLAKMRKVAEESAKISAFAEISRHLAHDFRGPLGVFERILTASESDFAGMRSLLKDSLNRMYSMIESLRYGEVENFVKRSRVQLDFGYIAQSLQFKARDRNIVLMSPDSSRQLIAFVDQPKIERGITNLVSNAIDFARSIVCVDVEERKAEWVILVRDDGPGVPDSLLPILFQRGATQGKADGTGLGLAYVRQIMRGHGGDVFYRRENGFTVFECILPKAFETGEDQTVENSALLEIQLLQKIVRTVAICLEPPELCESVHSKLASLKSDEYIFTKEWKGANIVVSNTDAIMFEVMSSDSQEHISVTNFDEAWTMEILKRKFNLA